MPSVFLNGAFVDRDDARISVFDAGLQHAVGLFETMLAIVEPGGAPPTVFHLRAHLQRLAGSARALGLSDSLRTSALAEAVERTAAKAAQDFPSSSRFRLRLTITGGDLSLLEVARAGGAPRPQHDPTVLITGQPATLYPDEMFERGVSAVIGDLRINPLDPFAGHKTLNYWPRLRELQVAAAKRAGEAILFQVTNHLAGGCVSNIFLIKGDRLLTPIARGEEQEVAGESPDQPTSAAGPGSLSPGAALPSPVLPGIVRSFILSAAPGLGLEPDRRMLTIDDLLNADEVFLTNSSWGVLPIVRIEREAIGDGAVGPVTLRFRRAWLDETAAAPTDL
ncbi:MAG: aminotransferase class IV [Phycisphaerales bacterium]|nr:aminotransferase class IV [Phycisphaerales bacterium]